MKKNLVALAVCLAIVVLVSGCSGGGSPAIDRQQAQMAFAAVLVFQFDSLPVSLGTPATQGVDWLDNGTSGLHMKRTNLAGTLALDWNPSTGYPNTATLTAIAYHEPQTGYILNGTIVGDSPDSSNSTTTYNLTLSHPTLTVKSITGTLTAAGSTTTGSLSFNGVPYTFTELTTP